MHLVVELQRDSSSPLAGHVKRPDGVRQIRRVEQNLTQEGLFLRVVKVNASVQGFPLGFVDQLKVHRHVCGHHTRDDHLAHVGGDRLGHVGEDLHVGLAHDAEGRGAMVVLQHRAVVIQQSQLRGGVDFEQVRVARVVHVVHHGTDEDGELLVLGQLLRRIRAGQQFEGKMRHARGVLQVVERPVVVVLAHFDDVPRQRGSVDADLFEVKQRLEELSYYTTQGHPVGDF
mmetsp:Transcript_33519/g.57457  ORF Transcript_33519/g.57457 Transcript_33519/m.57457 type:complete len:229 (-) Transcript_33519:235-921(-)